MKPLLYVAAAMMLAACSRNPEVVLETDRGDIVIELYTEQAPKSAADFLYYVDHDLYDAQGFYRVVRPDNDPRQMGMTLIQGGLLSTVPVTPPVDHEPTNVTGLSHTDGAVSMAREDVGSGSAAYFFITIGDNQFLDHGGARNPDGQGYAVFGRVVEGMDIVRDINGLPSEGPSAIEALQGQFLPEPVYIKDARRK